MTWEKNILHVTSFIIVSKNCNLLFLKRLKFLCLSENKDVPNGPSKSPACKKRTSSEITDFYISVIIQTSYLFRIKLTQWNAIIDTTG